MSTRQSETKKCVLIINEQHRLFPEQEFLLREYEVKELQIPANGWNLTKIREIAEILTGKLVIFASPVPALMALLQTAPDTIGTHRIPFRVFHNSRREKRELPNGKIIQTVSATGWELV